MIVLSMVYKKIVSRKKNWYLNFRPKSPKINILFKTTTAETHQYPLGWHKQGSPPGEGWDNRCNGRSEALKPRLVHDAAGAYPGIHSMKRLGVFLLPLDGMLVHRRSLSRNLFGFPNNSPVPIYIPGWREVLWELSVLSKNTTQCTRPGLEPGPFVPGRNALTIILGHCASM